MAEQLADIGEFNNPEVLRVVWETFVELARQPEAIDPSKHFNLEGQVNGVSISISKSILPSMS